VNTALTGTIIYNTNIDLGLGVFVWDGDNWQPVGEPYIPHPTVPAPTCPNPVPAVTFMAYNLGADVDKLMALYPDLSPAKQQMKYLANHDFNKLDATVYGGLFQWGRKDFEHAVKIPEYTRYDGAADNAVVGQTSDVIPPDRKFYYSSSNWYKGTSPAPDALWGNGVAIGTAIDGGVYSSNSSYYQKPVRTQYDPCPAGWRVPTQDEWERLANYGCGTPQTAGGDITPTISGHSTINSGLTWIPVVCNKISGQCIPSKSWTTDVTSTGYAVYKASVWTAAKATGNVYAGLTDSNVATIFTGKSLHDDDAPEPLLFLPTAGHRNAGPGIGGVGMTGSYGYYWSSTIDVVAVFYSIVDPANTSAVWRSHGFSVRCVKE
ncbi:MAG: fibrobacter succinogenes major paralogous domain-containing protein, partial [Prevotellaceae bacterium]|nr:fibrobacter succinogenes major paralogous domain-containing protein [Prevotellaceae bacterium]